MVRTLSRLNEDLQELNRRYYPDKEHLVVMDISDILEEMHTAILAAGEEPAYGHYRDGWIVTFIMEIHQSVGYLPFGITASVGDIRNLLDDAWQYFDVVRLTPFQRTLWQQFARDLAERYLAFRMYDPQFIHQLDFHDYRSGALYLIRPDY